MKRSTRMTRTSGAARRGLRSWSYSTWGSYEECPKRVYFGKVDKSHGIKDELGPAAQRGSKIHADIEGYLKARIDVPTKDLKLIHFELDELKASPTLVAEGEWAFTRAWTETRWDDWTGAWVRMKLDAHDIQGTRLRVIDFKTGKERNYEKQLELYGLGGFKRFPQAEEVEAEIWYTDFGKIDGFTFTRRDAASLQKTWEKRVAKMMADTEFRPRPGNHCRWCPFSKAKNGPCEY